MDRVHPLSEKDGRIERFWRDYLETLPQDSPKRNEEYAAEAFGDSPELADELAALILAGTKTATCSALWEYESEDEPLPEIGGKLVVLDGDGEPQCIIETTEVEVRRFDEVDEDFAYEEGEGDRSLESWRAAHKEFFARSLARIDKRPTPDMPLVCERFRVVYGRDEREVGSIG